MTDLSATETDNASRNAGAAVFSHSGPAACVRDYFGLLKPRVMTLVVFTGFVGLWVAPGHIHPFIGMVAVLCIAVGAGASGAINMWYDRDIDAVMKRTQSRALPSGKIDPDEALTLGVILSLFAVMLMGLAVNYTAAALLALASAFYVFVYTAWLKRRTAQNIVIGGAAGAFPPMIGWAAVTGDVSIESIVLFSLIFIWTPPHFWALALFANHDYERAGVPMLPVVAGEAETKRQMLFYTLVLFPLSLAPYFLGMAGISYLAGAAVLSGLFVISALRVLKEQTGQYKAAKRMFGYSVFYLFALFALLMI